MRVVARYSFAGGEELVQTRHLRELSEMVDAIGAVDAEACRSKVSAEKTMVGRLLYAPKVINRRILDDFLYTQPYRWGTPERTLPFTHTIPGLGTTTVTLTTDGVKNNVALEIQLGKYAFFEYDICAKLPI